MKKRYFGKLTEAAATGTRPMLASSELTGRSRATVARPRLVESVKGMQNHMTPPSRYPCHAAVGVEAMALCK